MEVDCNGIKRKPPLDWDHLLRADSDDDRPPELVVKSDHEITENQMIDELMIISYLQICCFNNIPKLRFGICFIRVFVDDGGGGGGVKMETTSETVASSSAVA
ncbi:hypothetical protein L1987_21080 [Smallanthus sonchifolius]|uniref:Uncharacterized protein n=1 Tax=Smallanthus sonchifolius TaxID=185202 RepID=A0ACB9ISW5_9ASTR|nr:hypothetical protein L1987_21080 [Smallanthus sonchifolius]